MSVGQRGSGVLALLYQVFVQLTLLMQLELIHSFLPFFWPHREACGIF